MTRKPDIKASICLYGTREAGFYCLGDTSDGRRFGEATNPAKMESATAALMHFARVMSGAGVPNDAPLAVHMDIGGVPMMATKYKRRRYGYPDQTLPLMLGTMPYFGDLVWERGTVVVVEKACDGR